MEEKVEGILRKYLGWAVLPFAFLWNVCLLGYWGFYAFEGYVVLLVVVLISGLLIYYWWIRKPQSSYHKYFESPWTGVSWVIGAALILTGFMYNAFWSAYIH